MYETETPRIEYIKEYLEKLEKPQENTNYRDIFDAYRSSVFVMKNVCDIGSGIKT